MKKNPDNLHDWLEWQQGLHPKNIDFKLERIKSVYKKLNIDKIAKKIIIVAGTNGKGSTVAILESILHQNDFSVGTFSSPHILAYNERIKINKKEVEDSLLLEAFEKINELRGDITLTYFEFATLSAFYIFNKQNVDYAILEVGLGGRLDATNIIDSDLSIISSIGIDHTEFLGTTIDSIALEKAGVMRPFCSCIYADINPPSSLLSYAKNNGTSFLYNQNDFNFKITNDSWVWNGKNGTTIDLPLLPLIGDFQYNHAGAALQALEIIEPDIFYSVDKIREGIKSIVLLGRFQIYNNKPEIILDVAHNADSALKLKANLDKFPKKNTIAVVGFLGDKDVYSLTKPFASVIDHWYCGTIESKRGMNSDEIKTRMKSVIDDNFIKTFENMEKAFLSALLNLKNEDRLIIYGSFYTVSEFLIFSKKQNMYITNESS
jgi:dihydrofolate synthase/folylpolyglutamate synthase